MPTKTSPMGVSPDAVDRRSLGPAPRRTVVAIAAVAGIIPAAIDMYLPALPDIADELAVSTPTAQLTLTLFLAMLALGQLVGGPVSDAVGRRGPILIGLSVFLLGTIAAAAAPNAELLVVSRIGQGGGAAIAYVGAISVIRDIARGVEAARLFALMTAISGVAPIVAPVVGGVIADHLGWRAVFLFLSAATVGVLALVWFNLPESLPSAHRTRLSMAAVCRTYMALLRNAEFVLFGAAAAATMMFLFAYIAGSPFVYQRTYGLSGTAFGVVFGAACLASVIGARAVGPCIRRVGLTGTAALGTALMATGVLALALLTHVSDSVVLTAAACAVAMLGFGLSLPVSVTMALDRAGSGHGAAAALIGAAEYAAGAAASLVAGSLVSSEDMTGARHWAFLLVVIVLVVGLFLAWGTARARRPSPITG